MIAAIYGRPSREQDTRDGRARADLEGLDP